MLEATHVVKQDVFDSSTGEKRLTAGEQVKVIDLGDHCYAWRVPHDPLAKPVELTPWMVSRSLAALAGGTMADPAR